MPRRPTNPRPSSLEGHALVAFERMAMFRTTSFRSPGPSQPSPRPPGRGFGVDINGIRTQTPFVLDELIGFEDTIGAPDQTSAGTSYGFVSWSDGGAQTHTLVAPTSDQSYVATFQSTGAARLVAAYAFDEGVGTTATDASGNGNTGAIGTATWTTAGKNGGALVFNGTSARVTVNDANSLDLTTAVTLAAWVRPSNVSSVWRDVIYKGDDLYYLDTLGVPAFGGTFSPSALLGTAPLVANTWTHLAGSYDESTMRLSEEYAEYVPRFVKQVTHETPRSSSR